MVYFVAQNTRGKGLSHVQAMCATTAQSTVKNTLTESECERHQHIQNINTESF